MLERPVSTHVLQQTRRMPSDAGIALGPILFILAMLALLATVMSSGIGQFGLAGVTDRISADISSQANLIRAKITECNLTHGTDSNYDGYPSSDTTSGTPVSALDCSGDASGQQNLWTGARVAQLPPPTAGFSPWYYINTNGSGLGGTATGGRCIWTAPTSSNPKDSTAIVQGLTKAASKFTHAASDDGASEVNYDPSSNSQKFVLWITLPIGTASLRCAP